MRRKSLYIFALTAIAFAGCQKNEINPDDAVSDGIVKFAPSISGNGVLTKSQSASAETLDVTLTSDDGTMSIPMTCESSEGIGMGEATSGRIATKGELINEFGPGPQPFDINKSFKVKAWDASTSANIIPGTAAGDYQTVTYSTSSSLWSTSENYYWNEGETKTFYAYSNLPSSGASITNTTAESQTLTYTVPTTASAQTDILMGSCTSDGKSGNPATMTGTASIRFYHPLTAVKFKKGTLSDGVSISGISIEGIYTSGKTVQTLSTGSDFVWTKTDGSEFARMDEKGTASLSDLTVNAGGFIGDAIVLIPETFASDTARIAVSLSTPTGSKTLYYPLKGKTFRAGWTNVFTIGYENEYIDVNINQSVVSGIARSLGVRNVGNDNAYIRLAVTACWIDAVGNILKGYTDFTAGGTPTGLNTTEWAMGTDGFYYYKKALSPGKNTKALFTSFEPEEAPAEGLTFEMKVSVQAVGACYAEGKDLSDNAKSAWGTDIPVTDAIEE